jgi:hypothetical protein
MHNKTTHMLRDSNGLLRSNLRKEIKHAKGMLERHWIETNDYVKDQRELLNLLEFTEGVRNMDVPLFPYGRAHIASLLRMDEIEEIVCMLQINIAEIIRRQKKNGTIAVICQE